MCVQVCECVPSVMCRYLVFTRLPYGSSCISGLALPSWWRVLHLLLQDGHDQVVLRHQVVLHYEACEPVTQERLVLHTHTQRERDHSYETASWFFTILPGWHFKAAFRHTLKFPPTFSSRKNVRKCKCPSQLLWTFPETFPASSLKTVNTVHLWEALIFLWGFSILPKDTSADGEDWDRATNLLVRGRPFYPLSHSYPKSTAFSCTSRTEAFSYDTYLILVKYLAVVEVGMREYPIDATTDGAEFSHWRLFDAHPRRTNQT